MRAAGLPFLVTGVYRIASTAGDLTRARCDKQATSEREPTGGQCSPQASVRAQPRRIDCAVEPWANANGRRGTSNSRVPKLLQRSGLNARDAVPDRLW